MCATKCSPKIWQGFGMIPNSQTAVYIAPCTPIKEKIICRNGIPPAPLKKKIICRNGIPPCTPEEKDLWQRYWGFLELEDPELKETNTIHW